MASPVLIFLGLLFLVIGIVYFFFQVPKLRRELERRTEQTTAIISRGKYVHKRRGGSYYLYDLDYTVSGQDYGLKKVKSHSHFAEGDELSVSFNPDDPSDAHIDKFHTRLCSDFTIPFPIAVVSAFNLTSRPFVSRCEGE